MSPHTSVPTVSLVMRHVSTKGGQWSSGRIASSGYCFFFVTYSICVVIKGDGVKDAQPALVMYVC